MTEKQKRVAIFGAGIAGLSAAHEFAKLGYIVHVYELENSAGGFFRSSRMPSNHEATEYSWHGIISLFLLTLMSVLISVIIVSWFRIRSMV